MLGWAEDSNFAVARAFIRLQKILAAHKQLAGKPAELEQRIEEHDEEEVTAIFEAVLANSGRRLFRLTPREFYTVTS